MEEKDEEMKMEELKDEEIKMEEDKEEKKALLKPKRIIKPRPKLDEQRIMDPERGLKKLYKVTKDINVTGNTVIGNI